MVPLAGIEPARPYGHLILSQARLPVPPQGQRREVVGRWGHAFAIPAAEIGGSARPIKRELPRERQRKPRPPQAAVFNTRPARAALS